MYITVSLPVHLGLVTIKYGVRWGPFSYSVTIASYQPNTATHYRKDSTRMVAIRGVARRLRCREVRRYENHKGDETRTAGLEAVAMKNHDHWRKPYLTDQDRICDIGTGTLGYT